MTVHNHPPYEPICNERTIDGQLRGACLTDDGQPATVCTGADTCDAPTHVHGCYADFLGHCDNPTDHDPSPAPAYLDPLHDELDRLRTENAELRAQVGGSECLSNGCKDRSVWPYLCESHLTEALAEEERRLEEAEARVNSLHTQLDEQIAFNRQRSDALNRTGADNDQLRATIARIEKLADEWHREAREMCRVGGESQRPQDYSEGHYVGVMTSYLARRVQLRAAIADQEPARE